MLNPVNAVCLDNPDSLLVCDHGLVGVFIPTIEEYKNSDHLLRRLWLSRMVYSEQMMPLVILDGERIEKIKSLGLSGLMSEISVPEDNGGDIDSSEEKEEIMDKVTEDLEDFGQTE